MHRAAGITSNDIDLGYTSTGNIEFTALVQGCVQLLGNVSSDINHAVIAHVYTAIGYMLAVISFCHTQLLGTITMI